MKNLFKTLITVITVVCMLSSMTAFAASQTTVTKYGSNTNVNVVTTVSGVEAGVIVTYLVADDVDNNGADASEIKYINQATSTGEAITFSYAITGDDFEVANAIADVKFGSDNADVAGTLADDKVIFDDIEFVVTDTEGNVLTNDGAELVKEYFIGKGETVDATIAPLPGYDIKSITIGGVAVDASVYTHSVAYKQKVEVVVEAIKDTTVYLFTDATATVEDGYEIYDQDNNKLEVVTGIGYFVGGPVDSAAIVFDGCDIDGAHDDYTYAAADVDKEAKSGYFAVQLASANKDDLKAATKAIVYVGDDVVESK